MEGFSRERGALVQISRSFGHSRESVTPLLPCYHSRRCVQFNTALIYDTPRCVPNFSLSTFDMKDLNSTTTCSGFCRYPGYDNDGTHPDGAYSFNDTFYRILCARLFFVICYILTISFLVATLRWLIPDIPQKLKWKMERERFKSTQLLQSNVTSENKDNVANEE